MGQPFYHSKRIKVMKVRTTATSKKKLSSYVGRRQSLRPEVIELNMAESELVS
jgi:hypothetical protein